MKRVRALVSGRVQGVFYRASTHEQAISLELKGWVRNLENGQVEWVAEGPESLLKQLIEWCRTGPPAARVDAVEATWHEASGEFTSFEVRR